MSKKLTKHHRRNRHNGGDSRPENISYVPNKKHEAFHTVFGSMNSEEICSLLNKVWGDYRYHFSCERK